MNEQLEKDFNRLKEENANLQKQINKKEKWIEKDERLAKKSRVGRLVTVNDINDPSFSKKYPNARIGDEFNDPEPLFWKIGLKRPPTLEEKQAQIAAQFARDLRESEVEYEELLTEFDDEDEGFTEEEVQAFLHQSAIDDAKYKASQPPKSIKAPSPTPKEETPLSAPQNAGESGGSDSPKEK